MEVGVVAPIRGRISPLAASPDDCHDCVEVHNIASRRQRARQQCAVPRRHRRDGRRLRTLTVRGRAPVTDNDTDQQDGRAETRPNE